MSGTTGAGVIQEIEGENDASKSPISSVETQQQFSPGSVTRSKTFRKSAGLSESALVTPNHEIPKAVDIKKEISTPISSSSRPRSMIPQLHQQKKVRRDSIESESLEPAKITWMETIDNLTLQQPAANKQVSGYNQFLVDRIGLVNSLLFIIFFTFHRNFLNKLSTSCNICSYDMEILGILKYSERGFPICCD